MKISAVVPTYNTDPIALARLVDSIDKQTMNKDEYELIFVDDGSTTDIYDELKNLEDSRKNVLTKQIPNSGWGSRPRNIGVNMASGDYILFLDHDDYIFPEAFERVYEFGIRNNADVVNGKEVRTKGWSWGWNNFKENIPSAEKLGISSLLPMTPHKFYRRKFLLENDIKFNEGARVLWEDVYFNTKVFVSGAKVAVLSDYPTYYWIATGSNSSSSFGRDPHEKWEQIRNLFTFFNETIADRDDLKYMIKHWYRTRALGILGSRLLHINDERIDVEFMYAKKIAEDFVPESIDYEMTLIDQARSYFLRRGKIDELRMLARQDESITARSYVSDIKWIDGELLIHMNADLTLAEKEPYKLSIDQNKLDRAIPNELKDEIPDRLLDITDFIASSTYEASILGRKTRVSWSIPAEKSKVETTRISSDEVKLTGTLVTKINLQKAALGNPLDKQPWDVATRFSALGYTFHKGLVAPKGFSKAALINGYSVVAYQNKSQLLTVDIGSKVKSVVKISKPAQSDLIYNKQNGEITVDLKDTYVHGYTKIKGQIIFDNDDEDKVSFKYPAYLVGDDDGARITATSKLPEGKYWITTIFEGRKSNIKLYVDVSYSRIEKLKKVIGNINSF
ncbi:glycosyltransferase family A protein [Lentibacillus sp. N15]|uniref:glycosyltransferase family 2 protein n=1 Tax=Lentibacillus songyuanensis TaxID=3136161 RepID=UPI0031BBAFB9